DAGVAGMPGAAGGDVADEPASVVGHARRRVLAMRARAAERQHERALLPLRGAARARKPADGAIPAVGGDVPGAGAIPFRAAAVLRDRELVAIAADLLVERGVRRHRPEVRSRGVELPLPFDVADRGMQL